MKIKLILKKFFITILSLIIITTQTSSYALAKGLFYDSPRNYDGAKFDINDPETHKGSSYVDGKCNSGNLTIFDPAARSIDTNIDQGNDHCIAYIATFASILALQGLAVDLTCVQDPIFAIPGIPSPPVIPIDITTQALKGIAGTLNCAKRSAEAAALTALNPGSGLGVAATQSAARCCTASAVYGITLSAALSSLAIIYGVAASESKRAIICGSEWNGWKDNENEREGEVSKNNAVEDRGPYQKCILNLFNSNSKNLELNKIRDGFSNCEEMGFGSTEDDINKNKEREITNKFFREYLFSGIEYIDRSNSACKNPFYSSHEEEKMNYFKNTLGYSNNKKNQRYYFTGPASHSGHNNNFACERFKPVNRTLRDDPEMREAYDCCLKKSLETICIERERIIPSYIDLSAANTDVQELVYNQPDIVNDKPFQEYTFCTAGEKCMMTNVTYYAYRAQKPEHNGYICAHSYSVCPFNYSVGFGTETLLENEEAGNNKKVNFCQYLNHCVKSGYSTSDFEMNFSGKSGAYISKACKNLRGDSQNHLKYESDILLKNSKHFSAPIAQCFKETIVNFLLNRASETKCKSSSQGLKVFPDKDGKCPNDEYEYKEGELLDEKYKSILQTIKDKFLQVIKIAMILAVIFFGGTILLSASESLKSKVIFTFLLKFIVVMYFVLGTAWQDYLIEGIIDSSTQFSEITFIPYKDFVLTDNSRRKSQSLTDTDNLESIKKGKIAEKDSFIRERADFRRKKSVLQQRINSIDEEELPPKLKILQEKELQKDQQGSKISELQTAYSDIMRDIGQFESNIDQYKSKIIESDNLGQRIAQENAQFQGQVDIAQNAIDSFSKQDLLDIFSTKIQDLDNEFDQYLTDSNSEFLDFKNDIETGNIEKIDIAQGIIDANSDGSLLEKHAAIIAELDVYISQNIGDTKKSEIETISNYNEAKKVDQIKEAVTLGVSKANKEIKGIAPNATITRVYSQFNVYKQLISQLHEELSSHFPVQSIMFDKKGIVTNIKNFFCGKYTSSDPYFIDYLDQDQKNEVSYDLRKICNAIKPAYDFLRLNSNKYGNSYIKLTRKIKEGTSYSSAVQFYKDREVIDFVTKYQDLALPDGIQTVQAEYETNKQSISSITSSISSPDLESISDLELSDLDLSFLDEAERLVIVTRISDFQVNIRNKKDLEERIENNNDELSSETTKLSSQFEALKSYKNTNIIKPISEQYQKLTTETEYDTDITALDYLSDENFALLFPIAEAANIETGAVILQNLQDFMSSKFKVKLDFEDDCFSNFDEECAEAETGYIDYFKEIADAQNEVDILQDQKKCFNDHTTVDLVNPPCQNDESISLFKQKIESKTLQIDQLATEIDGLIASIETLQGNLAAAKNAISSRRVNKRMDDCKFPRHNYLNIEDHENAQYPPGKSYLKVWDTLDCKILKAIGLTPNISVPNMLLIMLAALFTGGLGVIFFIATFIFAFFLISLTLRALHIFIMSIILIALLIYISPITIICILFEKTKKIFDGWSRLLAGNALQPIFLFAYLGIMISMFDYLIIGSAEIIILISGDVTQTTINCKVSGEAEVNDSIYCIFKIADLGKSDLTGFEALGVGIPILRDLNQERVNHIFKSALLMYIFAKFIDKISDFAARLVGSSRLESDTPGVSAMTKKSYNFARSIQKRGTRVMKRKMSKAKNTAQSVRNYSKQNQGAINRGANAVGSSTDSANRPVESSAHGDSEDKTKV